MNWRLLRSRLLSPRAGLALFLLLAGWYILTSSGHTYTSDEETMLAAGESLVSKGSFALPYDFLMNHRTGEDGQRYSRYGPGQSLAAVPFIAVGRVVALAAPRYATSFIVRLFVLLLPALITAATATLLYAWARELGYGARVALLVALLYGLGLAWPYSRTFFAEPLTTFFLVLCAYGLRRESRGWWVVAGAAAGCAVVVKLQALLLLPLIAGYGLLLCFCPGGVCPMCSRVGSLVGRVTMGLVGVLLPLAFLLLYNIQVFGGPFQTGYGGVDPTGLLDWPWQEGLYGLLLSTGKGLLLFSPTVLIGLVGMAFRWRQQWREALLGLAVLSVSLAFYCRLSYWHGDGSWGPRYLVFVLPFVYLPAAGVLSAIGERRARLAGAGVAALAAVTFLIQLLPVLVNLNTYLQMTDQYQRHFTPSQSPLVGHVRLWQERASEWWLRVDPPAGTVVLRDGFSYSEGERNKIRGDVLPRWSYADARMQLYPFEQGPLEGRLVVGDHRPWPIPRAQFALLLDGAPLEGVECIDLTGQNIEWELRFHLTEQQARAGAELLLQSDTWNPDDMTDDNPRDEELGLLVQEITVSQDGRFFELREALPIPTVKRDRRALWLWYYDTPHHHLFDAWLWYLFVAGLPPAVVALLLVVVALPSLVALLVGGRGVAAVLRGG